MHILLMNKKKFDSLTPEHQAIIREAAREALVWQRGITDELEQKAWDAFKEKGIEVTILSDEERAKLVELTAPVRDEFAKQIPANLLQLLKDTQK